MKGEAKRRGPERLSCRGARNLKLRHCNIFSVLLDLGHSIIMTISSRVNALPMDDDIARTGIQRERGTS